jgi:hypothetical protein
MSTLCLPVFFVRVDTKKHQDCNMLYVLSTCLPLNAIVVVVIRHFIIGKYVYEQNNIGKKGNVGNLPVTGVHG